MEVVVLLELSESDDATCPPDSESIFGFWVLARHVEFDVGDFVRCWLREREKRSCSIAAARFHDGDELRESWWCSDIGFAEGDCSSDLVRIEVGESVEPGTLHLVWIGACPEVGEASAVDCGEASEETFNQTMRFGLLVCIR